MDIVLHGEIDIASLRHLTYVLHEVHAYAPHAIHLDLTRVSFFSAAGVSFLVELAEAATALGATLYPGPYVPRVRRVLSLAGEAKLLHWPPKVAGAASAEATASMVGDQAAPHPQRTSTWDALVTGMTTDEQKQLEDLVLSQVRKDRKAARARRSPTGATLHRPEGQAGAP